MPNESRLSRGPSPPPVGFLIALVLAGLAARSNRKASGGYTGARPNWWKAPFVIMLLAAGTLLVVQTSRSAGSPVTGVILKVAYSALLVGLGMWLTAVELPFLRDRREARTPRQPNPWKLGLCFGIVVSQGASLLDSLRGPIPVDRYAYVFGTFAGAVMIGGPALWGVKAELGRWREQARRMRATQPTPRATGVNAPAD